MFIEVFIVLNFYLNLFESSLLIVLICNGLRSFFKYLLISTFRSSSLLRIVSLLNDILTFCFFSCFIISIIKSIPLFFMNFPISDNCLFSCFNSFLLNDMLLNIYITLNPTSTYFNLQIISHMVPMTFSMKTVLLILVDSRR